MFTPILEKNETDLIGSGKSNEKTKVVVAMSGGVDSSVAASIIKEHGYDVVGITLQLFDYGKIGKTKGTCCAGKDIYDAKKVASSLKIPHYVFISFFTYGIKFSIISLGIFSGFPSIFTKTKCISASVINSFLCMINCFIIKDVFFKDIM